MTLACVTNEMHDLRSCVRRNEHVVSCDGWAYRWNSERERYEATGKDCRGCLPIEARHGLLCWTCWESTEDALGRVDDLIAGLERIDRAIQRDNGGIRTTTLGVIPLAPTKLAIDQINSYRRTYQGDADSWVANEIGARDAVRFSHAVRAAILSHPLEETPHKVRRTRCTKCRQLTLVWNPPAYENDHVRVVCNNPGCGAEIDQTSFEKVARIEEPEKVHS